MICHSAVYRSIILTAVSLLSFCSSQAPPVFNEGIAPSDPQAIIEDVSIGSVISNEILIILKSDTSSIEASQVADNLRGNIVGTLSEINLYQIAIPNSSNDPNILQEAILAAQSEPAVEAASPNRLLSPLSEPMEWRFLVSPTNEEISWGQRKTNLLRAWESLYGDELKRIDFDSHQARIAIVDQYLDPSHSEFGGRASMGPYFGANTQQCYIPTDDKYATIIAHGNNVAGIALATGNEKLAWYGAEYGMAGVDWINGSLFYPTYTRSWPQNSSTDKLCQKNSSSAITGAIATASDSTLAAATEGIISAAMAGVRVINYSMGFNWTKTKQPNRLLANHPMDNCSADCPLQIILKEEQRFWRPIIRRLKSRGVLLVAAAGNNSNCTIRGKCDGTIPEQYWADSSWSYGPQGLGNEPEFDNLIVVTSVGDPNFSLYSPEGPQNHYPSWSANWTDLSGFSSIGQGVHIAAPGAAIYSLSGQQPEHAYSWDWGTSQAAPFVSGVASLVWTLNPNLSAADVRKAILEGSKAGGKFTTGNSQFSYPILDAYQVLLHAAGTPPPRKLTLPSDLTWHRTYDFTSKDTCSKCRDTIGDPLGKCVPPGFEIIYQKKVSSSERVILPKRNFSCATNQSSGYDTCFKNYMCNWSSGDERPDKCANVVDKINLVDEIPGAQLPVCKQIPGIGMRIQLPPGTPGIEGYDLGFWPIEPVRPAFKAGSSMYAYAQYFLPGPTKPGFRVGADCTPSIDPNQEIVEQHTDGSRLGVWHEILMPIDKPPVGGFSKVLSKNPNCTAWAQCLNSALWPPYDGDAKGGACIISRVEFGGYRETCDLENGRIEIEIDDCPGCLLSHGFDVSGWIADVPGQLIGTTTLWRIDDSAILMSLCQKQIPLNIRIPPTAPMTTDSWLATGIGYYDSMTMEWKETGAQITKSARLRVYKNGILSDTLPLDCATAAHNPTLQYGYQIQVMLKPNAKVGSGRDPTKTVNCTY